MGRPRADGPPRVAVVIATYQRSSRLARLVEAFEAQPDAPPFEVVLVDDCSTDETAAELARLAATRPWLRSMRTRRNSGPAVARNIGWRSCASPLIAFTDDDCVPQPGWVAGIARGLERADMAQGCTRPNPDQLEFRGPFSRTLHVEQEDGFYQTCNIGYRREWLERCGGFDEDFHHPAGEDTELAWRAIEAGATTTFRSDAVVHHDVRPSSLLATLKDTPRWESVVLAVRKHPPLRGRLHSRWFWRASHPPALAAAAGLAVAARMRPVPAAVGLALTLPYLRYRLLVNPLPHTRRRQRPVLIPAALLVDTAEIAVCAAASVRYGCLLL